MAFIWEDYEMETVVKKITRALLLEINVSSEKVEEFSGQIRERRMGRLFANFEPYDVQATRYEAKEEGRVEGREEGRKEGRKEGREQEIENGIRRLVHVSKKHGCTKEEAREDLMEQYLLDGDVAIAKVELYW